MTPPPSTVSPRVLSIQSHVVSGYCGNKSATFPLQLLEIEVDVVNTVQLSNHTQYKVAKGQVFESKDLEEIRVGLKANNLLSLYDHVLSGYVANVGYIESMSKLITEIKGERGKKGMDCWYTFDPVLGDDSTGYYVPGGAQVAEAYKKLIPLADIITPNRFEASTLSGIEIGTSPDEALNQARRAINVFHKLGVKVVVITSFEIADGRSQLVCILSYSQSAGGKKDADTALGGGEQSLQPEAWVIKIPKLDYPFTGTGDLFAALLTGWLHKTGFDLRKSFENTANSIHEILEDTLDWCQRINDGSVQSHELRLVQNKSKILYPKDRFVAEKLES